ncbi:hypothetical protein KEH51_04850 [[Brevibacterium] frigoritolerans]|uniref:Uncharacterized protein n=1 Tax=Peribacillus frigoritolerans TaxID=450367 RepID=A0A941FG81_9BACI|nr:hypothetical protein [Peribacillus frigoritolerans]
MSGKNGDKESRPLIYVDQAKISDLRGNMQSDFRTKKAKPQDSAEPELQEEAEHKEEKIEQVKREFGVYDAMKEIEKEITGLRKITEEYVPEQSPVEKWNILNK